MARAITDQDISGYARSLKRRAARARKHLEAERHRRLKRIEEIEELAEHFPTIQRVWLFGSLLQPERFHAGSDVDVAVEPPNTPELFKFAAALEQWLDCSCDVVPLQPETSLGEFVQRMGQCIYERAYPRADWRQSLVQSEDRNGSEREPREGITMGNETKSFRLLIAEARREWAIVEERATTLAALLPSLREVSPREADVGWAALQLHYWYTACERIFEHIATAFDTPVERSDRYHTDLLRQMSLDIPDVRPPILQPATVQALDEYRAFRHLVRDLYAGTFDPERVRVVVEKLPQVSEMVSQDWQAFEQVLWRMIEAAEAANADED
ncbi:MAG: nucleotidyltransferase domain-containing protein [Acidobacteria bacterium]|nr:nucleotidyltransferase domain-containing protein [Acidobacteriota bacterium]